MSSQLFEAFEAISSKEWKQKIQYELKGADYNQSLVWETLEGVKVKPFYHFDEEINSQSCERSQSSFDIVQPIFVHDVDKSNQNAWNKCQRGAEVIYFTIEIESTDIEALFRNLPTNIPYFITSTFLSVDFVTKCQHFAKQNQLNIQWLLDPVGKLVLDGNWFENQKTDLAKLKHISNLDCSFLSIKANVYQESGGNIVQQIAYTLSHLNEYLNEITNFKNPIFIEVSVGSQYFLEIAKLRALRRVLNALAAVHELSLSFYILARPSRRNKTLYDYNVNMLRSTTECMSAILGTADGVSNLPYDAIYHKDNEFGDRISRNQLLILKHESYFDAVMNPADGAYFIESLTNQYAEKALELFKDLEKNGGFITQLIEGKIQKKIAESAQKEQDLFDAGKEILLGTNKYPNPNDRMQNDLELFPFVKTNARKTLIAPLIPRRLAEKTEQERLKKENNL